MRTTSAATAFGIACGLVTAGCAQDASITEASFRPHLDVQQSTAVVPAFVCAVIRGGYWTVPAGATIVVDQRWGAKTNGLVQEFLNAQTTTFSLNGGAPLDVSDGWSAIVRIGSGDWRTSLDLPTGTSLAAGESLTFDLVLSFSHPVLDGYTFADEQSHKPLFFGPGPAFDFPCTVTGA